MFELQSLKKKAIRDRVPKGVLSLLDASGLQGRPETVFRKVIGVSVLV